MNREGRTTFDLLGITYPAIFTWGVYERVKSATGQCPYNIFTQLLSKATWLSANDLLADPNEQSYTCSELAEIVSAEFAYHLMFEMAREGNSKVTREEIQHGIMREGTTPSIVSIDLPNSTDDAKYDCDGYCFTVLNIAFWALGITENHRDDVKKKPKSENFLHLLLAKFNQSKST